MTRFANIAHDLPKPAYSLTSKADVDILGSNTCLKFIYILLLKTHTALGEKIAQSVPKWSAAKM